ncbi:RNB domain-containing ribonuclease [Streptomyces sp. LX-29]|uniref:RNB domain-containing ribonuclease n=1 Tax=Streptomyces sp. LX-29 TaxID=2900152 RepID=UPI00240DE4BA|nr:RNB domain-containing ribonuclease [Streptomyces sp. LX-29]WFB09829.1 RNB domain-containing ribonuclease [Streptomyces sp. LX-29]
MPRRPMHVAEPAGAPLRAALHALRGELGLPAGFPPHVLAEAEDAAVHPRPLPDREDATDVPLFTIDPPGARDLDQAMYLSVRQTGGFRVYYAIADVAAFVVPGGALDTEAHRRALTVYLPDGRIPLHPEVLSEEAASLLPDEDRPALLWQLDLDEFGEVIFTDVRRALVRSRARLDYAGVQRELDAGAAEEPLSLLRDVGLLREELERARGGISLTVPEQEIVPVGADGDGDGGAGGSGEAGDHGGHGGGSGSGRGSGSRDSARGHGDHGGAAGGAVGGYTLAYRSPLPVEGWNAQISLMIGMAAADLMLAAGTGILRTLPAAPDGAVGRLRRVAHALDVEWPHGTSYAQVIRSLDPSHPPSPLNGARPAPRDVPAHHAAFLHECTALLRGAGYTPFDGDPPDPARARHAALADDYAHCTAPLRRLVDRYTGELCLAAAAGVRVPDWVRAALDDLPAEMAAGASRANEAERECVDLIEAAVLRDRVGEVFDGCVIDVAERDPTRGTVQLHDPAVVGRLDGDPAGPELPLGRRLRVRLVEADPGRAKARFVPA